MKGSVFNQMNKRIKDIITWLQVFFVIDFINEFMRYNIKFYFQICYVATSMFARRIYLLC